MKVVKICVGSACHLKGSYDVIQSLQELIKVNELEQEIELKAAFCLGHCTQAVSVMLPSGEIISVSPKDVEAVFEKYINK